MYLAWLMHSSLPTVLFINYFIPYASCCRFLSRKLQVNTRDCFQGECLGDDLSERRCQGLLSIMRGLSSRLCLSGIMRFSLTYNLFFSYREISQRWLLFWTDDYANYSFHSRITAFASFNCPSYFSLFLSRTVSQRTSPPSALLLLSKRVTSIGLGLIPPQLQVVLRSRVESSCLWSASWWPRAK